MSTIEMNGFLSARGVIRRVILTLSVTLVAVSTYATPERRERLDVKNAVRLMSPGLNIGNTLEAIPTETSWGNPSPNEAYFRAARSAGFRSIRIPVAWTQYADAQHNIRPEWLAHVADVVKMARKADLYVMINVHWDGGWMQPTYAKQKEATEKLAKFWQQIATKLRDNDDHLLFAGTNETGIEGYYGPPTDENAVVQNGFNQAFVSAVRATGGRNRDRLLVVQGYSTDIDATVKVNLQLPKDTVKNRLMMEVHYYSPYNFALNEKSDIWQWGKTATDPKFTDTWGNEDFVDAQFDKMKTAFVDKGVPVILGEYSAMTKPKFPESDKYRRLWDAYVTQSAYRRGMVPMLWDTGAIFDRTTGEAKDPELIKMIMSAIGH